MNFAQKARETNSLLNKNNVLANFLNKKFSVPSVFTEKGLNKLIESTKSIKTVVNLQEASEQLNVLISSSSKEYIDDILSDMRALVPKGNTSLLGKVNAMKKPLQTQVDDILKGSKVLQKSIIFKSAKVDEIVNEVIETIKS